MNSNFKMVSVLAFLAFIISGIIWILLFLAGIFSFTIPYTWLFTVIAQTLTTIVVIWTGWQFAKGLSQFWRIFYIVIAVLTILGMVLPNFL